MRGGKREGSGRKSNEPSKIYRLPIALEDQIKELVEKHKKEALNPVTKSIDPITPKITPTNEEQRRRLLKFVQTANTRLERSVLMHIVDSPKMADHAIKKIKHDYTEYEKIREILYP